MREELKKIGGTRMRFIGTFVRFGTKPSYKGAPIKTLLFEDIRDKYGKEYCDHIWFTQCLGFKKLNLQAGDHVCFDARVKPYTKGYLGRKGYDENAYDPKPVSTDYKLSHPNNIVKHKEGAQGQLF